MLRIVHPTLDLNHRIIASETEWPWSFNTLHAISQYIAIYVQVINLYTTQLRIATFRIFYKLPPYASNVSLAYLAIIVCVNTHSAMATGGQSWVW